MIRHQWSVSILIVLALGASGCRASTTVDYPAVSGRRVQAASMAAASSAMPYRVGAYELVFTPVPGSTGQARRAALLVDLAGGQGSVRGFMEWDHGGDVPAFYVAGGWARQRNVGDDPTTVFELALNQHIARTGRHRSPAGGPGGHPRGVGRRDADEAPLAAKGERGHVAERISRRDAAP